MRNNDSPRCKAGSSKFTGARRSPRSSLPVNRTPPAASAIISIPGNASALAHRNVMTRVSARRFTEFLQQHLVQVRCLGVGDVTQQELTDDGIARELRRAVFDGEGTPRVVNRAVRSRWSIR